MKSNLLVAGLALFALTAVNAQADVRTRILVLNDVQVTNDSVMTYSYSLGGGCATHQATATVVLDSQGKLAVVVDDVSNRRDDCEAILTRKGTLNLRDTLRRLLGTSWRTPVSVMLPQVRRNNTVVTLPPVMVSPN